MQECANALSMAGAKVGKSRGLVRMGLFFVGGSGLEFFFVNGVFKIGGVEFEMAFSQTSFVAGKVVFY